MYSGKYFLAILSIASAITLIQWLFIGFLFHKYQAHTPAVWRKESRGSYTISTLVNFFFAFMFTALFYFWKSQSGRLYISEGIKFSLLCWLTFSIPMEIGTAVYVNYSRKFVMGKCLSSFVEYVAAGVIAVCIL